MRHRLLTPQRSMHALRALDEEGSCCTKGKPTIQMEIPTVVRSSRTHAVGLAADPPAPLVMPDHPSPDNKEIHSMENATCTGTTNKGNNAPLTNVVPMHDYAQQ